MYQLGEKRKIRFLLIFSVLLASLHVHADADYTREQRWADEIIPGILFGETVYLKQKNGHKFLGIYAEAVNAGMGVIIVHGMGVHPEWGFYTTLRQRLVDEGYTTFAIQMPVRAADAKPEAYPAVFPEAAERLQLAVRYLKEKNYKRIAIVSHSNGSRMTRVFMVANPPDVNTWVALSLTQGDTFKGISAPIFDLYGSEDLPHVLASVASRKTTLKGNARSKQHVIPGADHFFSGYEETMIELVKAYLDELQ